METIIMIDWLWMHDYDTFVLRSPFSVIFRINYIPLALKENLKFQQCMEQLLVVRIISCYNFLSNISNSQNTTNPFRILKWEQY